MRQADDMLYEFLQPQLEKIGVQIALNQIAPSFSEIEAKNNDIWQIVGQSLFQFLTSDQWRHREAAA